MADINWQQLLQGQGTTFVKALYNSAVSWSDLAVNDTFNIQGFYEI